MIDDHVYLFDFCVYLNFCSGTIRNTRNPKITYIKPNIFSILAVELSVPINDRYGTPTVRYPVNIKIPPDMRIIPMNCIIRMCILTLNEYLKLCEIYFSNRIIGYPRIFLSM